jgi:Tfp pilus assembly protein PilN
MIKVNLLESVTDRPSGVARVEDKVSSPRSQTLLLALTVLGLLVLGASYDYVSASTAQQVAQLELANQQRINQQMLAVNKEQADLERQTNDIQGRIDAIKRLRESQQGPGAVLREIKTRFDNVPGLYLKSIQQTGSELTIKGESPNESSVTKFGQSLEFSAGLFTNLNIETSREVLQATASAATPPAAAGGAATAGVVVPVEVVTFTVKCNYEIAKASAATSVPANQVAQKK